MKIRVFLWITLATLFPVSAVAVPILSILGGSELVIVTDDGAGDLLSGVAGQILFGGTVGGVNIVISGATTKPAIGSSTNPMMDLSWTVASTASSQVFLAITDTNFGPFTGSLSTLFDGTTDATSSFSSWYDPNNSPFGAVSLSGSSVRFGPGAFSTTVSSGPISFGFPTSLTAFVDIIHISAGQTSSGNLRIQPDAVVVPEPNTLALLSAGLLGLFIRRRRAA